MSERRWFGNLPSIHPHRLGPAFTASTPAPAGRARLLPAPPRAHLLVPLTAAVLLAAAPSVAQESPNYKLSEHVFNAAGHPADGTVLTSAGYRLRLDAVGEAVVGPSLASASYRADAGFVSGYPPPGPVQGLAFEGPTTLRWHAEPSVGRYNLYRDELPALSAGGTGICLQQDLASETTTDIESPSMGDGWFYLVTAQNRLDEEGTKGSNSAGAERPNPAPCP